MLFSTFCWHNEDNYLYSINYSHFGDTKQWYGVPGAKAASFEKVSQDYYRETMIDSPDMLHHMTTQISVSRLVANGVPVFHAKQQQGSFIITFPKAFHCGFSYGFNCGEAVNFASPDWLPFGHEADFKYRTASIPRTSVFSHARLLFTLKQYEHELNAAAKYELYIQLERILTDELEGRATIRSLKIPDLSDTGTRPGLLNNFTKIDNAAVDYDDQRMCELCKQVCLFSAIGCECSTHKVACSRHFHMLCNCRKEKDKNSKKVKRVNQNFLISWGSVEELQTILKETKRYLKSFLSAASMKLESASGHTSPERLMLSPQVSPVASTSHASASSSSAPSV